MVGEKMVQPGQPGQKCKLLCSIVQACSSRLLVLGQNVAVDFLSGRPRDSQRCGECPRSGRGLSWFVQFVHGFQASLRVASCVALSGRTCSQKARRSSVCQVVALASAVIAAPAVVVPVPDAFVVSAPVWCATPAPATGYISQGASRVQWEECILRCCGVTAYAAASSKFPSWSCSHQLLQ